MNKDIIYIDVEDDITAIIGKVKDAKEKIVALVPPKRIGVLQSAVNLRLLSRAAGQADKRLVLITNNAALTALASAAKLPVAKNLQSKPEIAQIPALDVDDGNDVIDGAQLPVGDLQRTADMGAAALHDPVVDEVIRENTPVAAAPVRATPPVAGVRPAKPRAKSGAKVPNFNKFRKKFVLIIVAAVLLVGFLVWAIFFAPRATVTIAARTTESSTNQRVVIGEKVDTNVSASTIKSVVQQVEKDVSEEFSATERKDVGEKATGSVRLMSDSYSALMRGILIPSGTELSSSSGKVYVTDEDVELSTTAGNSQTVPITAAERGESYNGASGTLSGAPSAVSATVVGATTGGTNKEVMVVSKDDVQRATDALKNKSTSEVQEELKQKFGDTAIVLDASFASKIDVTSSPAMGQEAANGKAKLTGKVTYMIAGVAKDELNNFLKDYFTAQLEDDETQRVYDNGADGVTFTNVSESNDTFAANLSATAKIGPNIKDSEVKELAKGKRFGEIQSSLESVQGINDVDIIFWPFWVNKAPNDTNRITVEFKLDESL